jgi:two-component system, sensor histidine kinase YesM
MRIHDKIILYSLSIIAIPLLLLSLFFFARIKLVIENEVTQTYKVMSQQFVDSIEKRAAAHVNLMENLVTFEPLKNLLTSQDELNSTLLDIGSQLATQIEPLVNDDIQEDIYLITIYSTLRNAALVTSYITPIEVVENEPWFDWSAYKEYGRKIVITETKGLKIKCLSIIEPIYLYNQQRFREVIGYARIDIPIPQFFDRTFAIITDEIGGRTSVFSESGELFYKSHDTSSDTWYREYQISDTAENAGKISSIELGNSDMLLIADGPALGLHYELNIPMDDIRARLINTGFLIIISFIALVTIFLVLVLMLTKPFGKRLSLLIRKINLLPEGDLTTMPVIDGNDEISLVDSHFNEMVIRSNDLIQQNYVQKLETKNAQLRELQAQLNPHFLFNTLELINSISSVYKSDEICKICENLGGILRYNLDTDSSLLTTLLNEIRNVRQFLAIQEVRYSGELSTDFDIETDISDIGVPRFILQPIVENVIEHAFNDKKQEMQITIMARHIDTGLQISVTDNGCGMNNVKLQDLRDSLKIEFKRRLFGDHRHSIGLKNISSRLQLMYDDFWELIIDSELGQGTKVTINFPTGIINKGVTNV